MEATEVRIGNLFNNGGLIRPVEPYDLNHWNSIAKEPIPLTEEWLERLGFEDLPDWLNEWKKDIYWLNEVGETFQLGIGVTTPKWQRTQIKYVHQLQNLYFALTGEELEIKPEK